MGVKHSLPLQVVGNLVSNEHVWHDAPSHQEELHARIRAAPVNIANAHASRGPLFARSFPFGYDSPAMEPVDPTTNHLRYPLAPNSQTACYSPWLKVRVLIRAALTTPWSGQEWAEVKQHLPWLLAEEARLRRQGWLN